MKLVSWNVSGFRSVSQKGFREYVAAENPDILCLQVCLHNSFLTFRKQKFILMRYKILSSLITRFKNSPLALRKDILEQGNFPSD